MTPDTLRTSTRCDTHGCGRWGTWHATRHGHDLRFCGVHLHRDLLVRQGFTLRYVGQPTLK